MKKKAFISFVHEESNVAEYIKEWFKKIFLGQLDVFVSSLDISSGNWLEQIRNELNNASFVFPLLSSTSKDRPWINFESGCAFIKEGVKLIPLCHRGLNFSDLVPPYSYFQSYNLTESRSMEKLVCDLSSKIDLDMPDVDYDEFCKQIIELDRGLCKFIPTFDELKKIIPNIRKNPIEVPVSKIESWEELDLRYKIHNEHIIELIGYSEDAMGLNIYNIELPEKYNYLIVKFENTNNSKSNDLDKLLKLIINGQNVKSYIEGHIHYNDTQFIYKSDGLFVYELPTIVKHKNKIDKIVFTFWRIKLQGLLMQLYLA